VANNVTIDTSIGFSLASFEVGAGSVNMTFKTFNIEVCGTEVISQLNQTVISKVFIRSNKIEVIEIDQTVYKFESDRANCPVTHYKLYDGQNEYTGSDLWLVKESDVNNQVAALKVYVRTDMPLDFQNVAIRAYSNSYDSYATISLYIHVCGYEVVVPDGSLEKIYKFQTSTYFIYPFQYVNLF
jgi:hypothetical protein